MPGAGAVEGAGQRKTRYRKFPAQDYRWSREDTALRLPKNLH
ncbi:MAG: hypothetical protein ACJAYX_002373 [Planctomycetota bacterium]|jgi:hypothetical protein